jgi:hypothetical protein
LYYQARRGAILPAASRHHQDYDAAGQPFVPQSDIVG